MSDDVETYLGGFYSPFGFSFGGITSQLKLSPFQSSGSTVGGGVYASNKRLFILGGGKATFPSQLNKIAPGSGKGDFVPSLLTRDQNDEIIRALSENKRFEFSRSQISQIELRKPPLFRTGSLRIASADGQTLEIKMGTKMQYDFSLRILQAFKSEAIKID